MAFIAKEPMPDEFTRWKLAERFGWTLEYIDALSIADFAEFLQVTDGENKARATLRKRK